MSLNALQGFVRIVELDSFRRRQMRCFCHNLRCLNRSVRWRHS